ncbi:MAG: GSCFA domain-containing protein [Candidatus Thorarchaeota archaeon]
MSKVFRRHNRKTKETIFTNPITMNVKPFISKRSKIFAIGSCFALEVIKYLGKKGYTVLNKEFTKDTDHNLIWYNTYSILYEFERAAGLFKQNKNDIWKVKNNKFQDPYRRCVLSDTKKELRKTINILDQKIKTYIETCDIIIITLGLVEVWKKSDNNRIICVIPGHPRGAGGGQDSTFKFLTYDENLQNMRDSLNILNKINNCRVIITTSPVPLAQTFRKMDHLVANTESKSILRAVCGQLEREFKNVTYYPAYEMATNFPKSKVFKADGRHVQPDFISKIMNHFENHFCIKETR